MLYQFDEECWCPLFGTYQQHITGNTRISGFQVEFLDSSIDGLFLFVFSSTFEISSHVQPVYVGEREREGRNTNRHFSVGGPLATSDSQQFFVANHDNMAASEP